MATPSALEDQSILFVTGRLAEASLREVVDGLSQQLGFRYEIAVPGVQVAALLHTGLLRRRLEIPAGVNRVILPGWCQGDPAELTQAFQVPFELGPKDLWDLPQFFGLGERWGQPLTDFRTEIVAEINHATQLPTQQVVREAVALSRAGADVIDLGCIPGKPSDRVTELVRALRDKRLRVSIDSFERSEVEQAVDAGVELILSCNHSNIDWVSQLGTEVVAIPDTPADVESLDRIVERLQNDKVPFRIDPIIEPIGMGFTASLQRYMDVRARYPQAAMMMGIGNISELTEVDSAGVNMLLMAICEELKIQSVLTTQVINWCRSSVAEIDAARRLACHAVSRQVIPKNLDSSLVMLRDSRVRRESREAINELAAAITDANFRIVAGETGLHLMNCDGHWQGPDAFQVFAEALDGGAVVDSPEHAFYLGYEMARAELARHLGKNYRQDDVMTWGLLKSWKASSRVHDHRQSGDLESDL